MPNDNVQSPAHYTWHPSGIECIETIQDPAFYFYSIWTYLWRAPYKGTELTDLKKALFYTRALIETYDENDYTHTAVHFGRWHVRWEETLHYHNTTEKDFLKAFTPEYRAYFRELLDTAMGLMCASGVYSVHKLESLLVNTIHNREGMPVAVDAKEET